MKLVKEALPCRLGEDERAAEAYRQLAAVVVDTIAQEPLA